MKQQAKVIFVSHGGGPLPLLNDKSHFELVEAFKLLKAQIETPKAIVIVSAHWEAQGFQVGSHVNPELIYDYSGFPSESYEIEYPAPGLPSLADEILALLHKSQLPAQLEENRGYDHGVFVPLKLLFPDASIPVVTVSIDHSFDPALHINLGQAIKGLSNQGILIVGSGMTFHNMSMMFSRDSAIKQKITGNFISWLDQTLASKQLTEQQRTEQLIHWEQAPDARINHPREEHLIPLHFCYGAAGSMVKQIIKFSLFSVPCRCYVW